MECAKFCKNDYMVEMNKLFKKNHSVSKTRKEYYKICKKTYCNKTCKGYTMFENKKKQLEFYKKIKNGFQKSYSKERINLFKKKGALSGCIDSLDYNV